MNKLCSVDVRMTHFNGKVDVMQWSHGDAFPTFGPSVGVDTETELITDVMRDPPVVVLGVFDPAHSVCYVVYWRDIPEFMGRLCRCDVEQRYFNLGFDELVIDNEDKEGLPLLHAINENRVFDMSIRIKLDDIAKLGYTRTWMNSLAQCTKAYENHELDKGDGTENSARLSFRRYNPDGSDYVITQEQAQYLPFDCISTWALGEAVPVLAKDPRLNVPFELAHVKGMVVLAHISKNGFPVDMKVWEALEKRLKMDQDEYRHQLLSFGFPDPFKDEQLEAESVRVGFHLAYGRLLEKGGLRSAFEQLPSLDWPMPRKMNIRMAIMQMWNHEPNEVAEMIEDLKLSMESDRTTMRKGEKLTWGTICEEYSLASIDDAPRDLAMQAYAGTLMANICEQLDRTACSMYMFSDAVKAADEMIDMHPEWLTKAVAQSPKKFFQNHVKTLMAENKSLKLDTTDKSKEIRLTSKDMWRLADLNINDPFLVSYTSFKHAEKLLSTYLNRKFICEDGRIRAHYTNILRTGRTSCANPNLQNLPSREHNFPIKNAFRPPEGTILCATDYSFIELVCLAQSCYTRFGYSVLRDVINADVDPHRWFAAVRDGIIDSNTDFVNSPEKCKELNEYLKENVSKEARQYAKMANFGFGGGMSAETFMINCREQGVNITAEQATRLRDDWVTAFREMKEHMKPEEMPQTTAVSKMYGVITDAEGDEEDSQEDDSQGNNRRYIANIINGMVRTRCSFCASLNSQFQPLAAYGLKLGMWNMAMDGYLDRLVNEVHDEVNYWLWPSELKVHIPIIEKCMVDGMRLVTPDVKVKVETSCMLHWDKNAVEYKDVEWDGDRPLLEEPPFVQEVYGLNKQEAN